MKAKRGNSHQGYPFYFDQFAGRQCTAIAYVAIVFFLNIHCTSWNEHHLDEIVQLGHHLYVDVTHALHRSYCPTNLLHSEINGRNFQHPYGSINDASFDLNRFYGVVGSEANVDAGSVDLFSALHDSFSVSPGVLLTLGDQTIALFHTFNSNSEIYLFDSHARSEYGIPDGQGRSVLLEFQNLIECYDYLERVYYGQTFDISTVSTTTTRLLFHDPLISNINGSTTSLSDMNTTVQNQFNEDDRTSFVQTENTGVQSMLNENAFIPTFHVTHDAVERFMNVFNPNSSCEVCPGDRSSLQSDINCNNNEIVSINSNSENFIVIENSLDLESEKNLPNEHGNTVNELNINNNKSNLFHLRKSFHNDHSYFSTGKLSSKRRRKKTNSQQVETMSADTVRNFTSDAYQTYIESTPQYYCKCCHRMMYRDQLFLLNKDFFELHLKTDDLVCVTCKSSVHKNKIPTLSAACNNLDTGEIPFELQNLNLIEKRLISQVGNFFTLILLPGFPVGQYGEKGYVIHFPVDKSKICEQLQSFCDSSKKMAIVSCSCQGRLSSPKLFSISKVCKALQWLKINNPLYFDISVPQYSVQNETGNMDNENFNPIEMSAISLNYSENPDIIDLNADNPVELHTLDHSEEKTFPWLFPHGINGYNTNRTRKLTLGQYYKFRFCNRDSRWRKDITYLINAVNLYEKQYLSQLISVYTRVRKSEHPNSRPLTANDVLNGTNPDFRENSYMFMKNIRGTVAYWKQVLFNLLAMIKNLGPPTIFMTLSCNDYHWEELAMTLQGKQKQDIDIKSLPQYVQKDPLFTAKHFERRWRGLLKHVINGPNKPLGVIVDYFARVEFQARGSPHMHIFLWVSDVPNLMTATNAEDITKYIDSVISTTIPDSHDNPVLNKLVTSLQLHSHRKYCLRRKSCRFNFPFPVCNQTRIVVPIDSVMSCRKFYETKRTASDAMVNAYNADILLHWRANMDIQMIGGPYGVAYYVCSYICKAEPETLKLAISNVLRQISNSSDSSTRS